MLFCGNKSSELVVNFLKSRHKHDTCMLVMDTLDYLISAASSLERALMLK